MSLMDLQGVHLVAESMHVYQRCYRQSEGELNARLPAYRTRSTTFEPRQDTALVEWMTAG